MNNILSFEKLNEYGIKNAFIGKPYDFSKANANFRSDIVNILDVDINKIYQCTQTHSDNVVIVNKDDDINSDKFNNVDGLITNVKGTTLLIKTADCQGIFLYDPIKQVIGNIHSGWVGTTKKIIIKAINIMVNNFGCNKEDIMCFFNPSINKCHFEIEDDALDIFKNVFGSKINSFLDIGKIKDNKQKYYLDLVGLNKQILLDYDINNNNIYIQDICTYCDNNYHSYRKTKTTLRNGCIISL